MQAWEIPDINNTNHIETERINMNKYRKNNKNLKKLTIIAASAILLLAVAFSIKVPSHKKQTVTTTETADKAGAGNQAAEVKDSDIVIPISEITENAKFYPAKINGTKLEVIAVKAPDGTIRTAFNTCQVCYSSGRGYYKQEGDKLVCQNCGNTFGMGDVEVTKGGCNPVPITDDYKTVDDKNITISKDTLAQATQIFANWKN